MSDFSKGFLLGNFLSSDSGGGNDSDGCSTALYMLAALIIIPIGLVALGLLFQGFKFLTEHGLWFYIGLPFFAGVWDLYINVDLSIGQKAYLIPLVAIIILIVGFAIGLFFQKRQSKNVVGRFFNRLFYGLAMTALMSLMYSTPIIILRTIYYGVKAIWAGIRHALVGG